MKLVLIVLLTLASLVFLWSGMVLPGAEGLGHHVMPVNDTEMTAAMLMSLGCISQIAAIALTLARPR